MPRLGRLYIPGGCYHVMGRGLERRNIFDHKIDKVDFLERLGIALKKTDSCCFAWAIMSNHYHLLIKIGSQPLSKLMSPLLTGYATNYNRRHKRSGYVFQNRFTSILCDEDTYLTQLLSYIHLNPWKAGMVPDISALDDYPWTGHAGLLGSHVQSWHSINSVLHLFADNSRLAQHLYREFIIQEMENSVSVNLSGGGLIRSVGGWENLKKLRREHEIRIGDERILGGTEFIQAILTEDSLKLRELAKLDDNTCTLSELVASICQYHCVDQKTLAYRGRTNNLSTSRQLVAYFAVRLLNIKSSEVEARLNVSQSGLSKLIKKGALYCTEKEITLSRYWNGDKS